MVRGVPVKLRDLCVVRLRLPVSCAYTQAIAPLHRMSASKILLHCLLIIDHVAAKNNTRRTDRIRKQLRLAAGSHASAPCAVLSGHTRVSTAGDRASTRNAGNISCGSLG